MSIVFGNALSYSYSHPEPIDVGLAHTGKLAGWAKNEYGRVGGSSSYNIIYSIIIVIIYACNMTTI